MLDLYTRNMMLTSSKYSEEREYWIAKLGGDLVMSGFLTDNLRQNRPGAERAAITSRISGETFEQMNRVVGGSTHAMYMMLLLGVTCLLSRYTGQEEIIVGMPSFKGRKEGSEETNRFYALRIPLFSDDTGKDLLLRIRDVMTEAWKHRSISYDMIKHLLGVAQDELFPLFNTVVLLENLHDARNVADLRADTVFSFEWQTDHVALTLDYNACLFRAQTMEQVEQHLRHVLELVTRDMQQPLSSPDILSEDERQQMLVKYNATHWECPQDTTLHGLFAQQAKRVPKHQAVWLEGESLTYERLDALSTQCAKYLIKCGVQPGDRVGVSAKRSLNMAVHVLGVLKAAAAYVPIDPDYPAKRKRMIIEHCGCRMTLGLDEDEELDLSSFAADDLDFDQNPDSLAYVIYTSGSTGTPKGVSVSHRAVVNTILDINHKFQVNHLDRLIGISSLCFDLSVYDLFGSWAAGATLILVKNQRDIQNLIDVAIEQQVTIWNSVPAVLYVALSYLDDRDRYDSLRLFLLSGDWVPLQLFGKVQKHFAGADFVSLGGATECSIWSIYYPIREIPSDWTSVPYGKPLANQQLYVLNQHLKPCPFGVEGEIHIGGAGLADCYFADEERTRESFLVHPQFGRLYKTGDFGVMKREGYITISGRRDFQVKVRGFRIDMKEIQAHLLKHEAIHEAVVTAREDREGNKYLVAYIVKQGELPTEEIRAFLEQRLPEYMIPSSFVEMEELPLSANGKLDLKALPAPEDALRTETAYQPPRNDVEQRIVSVWQKVLGVEQVGIHDNFFALGGDSFKALRVIAQLSFDFILEFNDLFEKQTVALLAEEIRPNTDNVRSRIEIIKQMEALDPGDKSENEQQQIAAYHARNQRYQEVDLNERLAYRSILLTGSTGYLGAYLVKQILEQTNSGLHLLVRGTDQQDAEQRIVRKIEHYHSPEWLARYKHRIQVVKGDIREERFGLPSAVYQSLGEQVDAILNAAANVKHYGRYADFYEPNVRGVEQLIEFSMGGTRKDIHHISTVGLASGTVQDRPYAAFSEYDLNVGQIVDNFYHQTKMDAENRLADARKLGIDVNIYRAGNLVFDSRSGRFQENIEDNMFYALLKSGIQMGTIPQSKHFLMDFSFIDYASRAIILLFDRAALRNETHHITNPNLVEVPRLIELLAKEQYLLRSMPLDQYLVQLMDFFTDRVKSEAVEQILRYIGVFNPNPSLTRFEILSDKTNLLLRRAGFAWPQVNEVHIHKMIEYCRMVQFLQ